MAVETLLRKRKELMTRTITSLVLAPIVLYLVHVGGLIYMFLIVIMAVLMAFEWSSLTSKNEAEGTYGAKLMWKLFGIGYIALPVVSLLWLRMQSKGEIIIYWMLAVVWATDIAAYFGGTVIGGWKIYPKISPNKTWSGLACGAFAAYIVGSVTATLSGSVKPQILIALSVVLAIYAQIGDFVESWVKRKFGAKDSGSVIPGHGGILDRVDGIVPVAPKIAMVIFFDKWGIF